MHLIQGEARGAAGDETREIETIELPLQIVELLRECAKKGAPMMPVELAVPELVRAILDREIEGAGGLPAGGRRTRVTGRSAPVVHSSVTDVSGSASSERSSAQRSNRSSWRPRDRYRSGTKPR
jgi:hypothetical protein